MPCYEQLQNVYFSLTVCYPAITQFVPPRMRACVRQRRPNEKILVQLAKASERLRDVAPFKYIKKETLPPINWEYQAKEY